MPREVSGSVSPTPRAVLIHLITPNLTHTTRRTPCDVRRRFSWVSRIANSYEYSPVRTVRGGSFNDEIMGLLAELGPRHT